MSKPKRKPPAQSANFGPAAQRHRLEVVFAPDPAQPNATIRRARRYDPLIGLLARDVIEHAHWLAAERFRTAYELSQGAREMDGGPGAAPWQRCHYSARVADARAEVEGSMRAVGIRLSAAFVGAVILQEPLHSTRRQMGVRYASVEQLVAEALARLLDYQSA